MNKKKEWYLHDGAQLWLTSCHSSYFASMIQSVTGVLTRPWFPPSPNPLGAHFPEQRLTIEPNKTLMLAKTCQVGVCALGRLSFQFRIPTKPRIRTLAKMSSFSLSLLHLLNLDKWQLAKCDVISSMHSVTNTFSSTPLLGPHSVYNLTEELLDESAEKAILYNWSLRRFHWQNYIWNWHL